jgi:hypothetical protein
VDATWLRQTSVLIRGLADFEDGKLFADGAPTPNANYEGSCHCGQIEWTVRLNNPQHILCHCDTCKKLGGGPFSCNQIVSKDDLRITKGSPRIYTYTGASGRPINLS